MAQLPWVNMCNMIMLMNITSECYTWSNRSKVLKLLKIDNNIKKKSCTFIPNYEFFRNIIPYHKSDLAQHAFLEDLCLYIAKGYHILSLVENPWFKRFVMHENPKVVFPSRHHLIKEIFLLMVSKKWIIMFFQLWFIVSLALHLLTFGCFVHVTIFLQWWLVLLIMHGNVFK
jgi:hypothetical protein